MKGLSFANAKSVKKSKTHEAILTQIECLSRFEINELFAC
jgi:hypothetical protein